MGRSARLLLLLSVLAVPACAAELEPDPAAEGEASEDESAIVPITQGDETDSPSALAAQPLDVTETDLLDVRGVGDAAWSETHKTDALEAGFGAALDRFDPSGASYRGDLSFINWETVVGTRCDVFASQYVRGKSYAFVSRPENLVEASERGFNLVGLSNNHSRDCHGSPETTLRGEVASSDMTARNVEALGDRSWLWAGVATTADADDASLARVRTFRIKGRDVRVAFASTYMGRPSCPRASCKGEKARLLESLRDARADLRILAIHSMAAADQDELVRLGTDFVEHYDGDVVFGHGPHVWKPVRVVRKSGNGNGTGVIFESLGNFIHPSLGGQTKNYIGRALFDARSLRLKQVQLLPVANSGRDVTFSSQDASAVQANLRWSPSTRGVYANVKP